MKKKISLKNQKGFTLIEIAIVLVIIGLLIGGVLKGQSMIQNARVKRLVTDMQGMTTAVIAFQDRYGQLPGDENAATPPGDANNGNANGLIDEATAGAAIQDLRLATLIAGAGFGLPTNTYSGSITVNNTDPGGGAWTNVNKVIVTNIPAEACLEIDTKYDNGVWNTGVIRGSAAYTATTTIATFGWSIE
jgi:prepilin-type N-terminal cleavage/methylation domain-containing protein